MLLDLLLIRLFSYGAVIDTLPIGSENPSNLIFRSVDQVVQALSGQSMICRSHSRKQLSIIPTHTLPAEDTVMALLTLIASISFDLAASDSY